MRFGTIRRTRNDENTLEAAKARGVWCLSISSAIPPRSSSPSRDRAAQVLSGSSFGSRVFLLMLSHAFFPFSYLLLPSSKENGDVG